MINKYGVEEWNELELNYSISQLELQSALSALDKARRKIHELGFKIYDQKKEIANLHKKIKELKNGEN